MRKVTPSPGQISLSHSTRVLPVVEFMTLLKMCIKALLDIILNPGKTNNTCLLCLKPYDTTIDVFETFEIHCEDFSERISLYLVIGYLFPAHDFFLKKACENCSNLLIQIYTLMKRNKAYQHTMKSFIDDINYKIGQKTKTPCVSYIINLTNDTKKYTKVGQESKDPDKKHKSKKRDKNIKMLEQSKYELICDICGKTCKTMRSLTIHRKGHHSKPCPYCKKILKTHQHFNVHVRNHETGHRRTMSKTIYKCNDCKYESCNKQTLEAHMNRAHLNLRPYICEICSKGFFKKGHLNEHIQAHKNVKFNTCETCGESFSRKKCLIDHLRLHSGDKPYSCEVCNDKFVTISRKNTHVKRKHREKQEVCDNCDAAFSLKRDLNRHKKLVHLVD